MRHRGKPPLSQAGEGWGEGVCQDQGQRYEFFEKLERFLCLLS